MLELFTKMEQDYKLKRLFIDLSQIKKIKDRFEISKSFNTTLLNFTVKDLTLVLWSRAMKLVKQDW